MAISVLLYMYVGILFKVLSVRTYLPLIMHVYNYKLLLLGHIDIMTHHGIFSSPGDGIVFSQFSRDPVEASHVCL